MDASPPRTPAESLAALLRWLGFAVDARRAFGLAPPLITLVIVRFSRINQLFGRIAGGRFFSRRRSLAPRRPGRPVPPPLRLPRTFGWLLPLLPDAAAAGAQLESLFRDPAMAALMQAAPAPMARALRPLCRMLGLRPPPVIAPPERPERRRKIPPAAPRPQSPDIPGLPDWLRDRRKPWSLARIRGSRRRS